MMATVFFPSNIVRAVMCPWERSAVTVAVAIRSGYTAKPVTTGCWIPAAAAFIYTWPVDVGSSSPPRRRLRPPRRTIYIVHGYI